MTFTDGSLPQDRSFDTPVLRRSLLLIIAVLATVGGAAIELLALIETNIHVREP